VILLPHRLKHHRLIVVRLADGRIGVPDFNPAQLRIVTLAGAKWCAILDIMKTASVILQNAVQNRMTATTHPLGWYGVEGGCFG